MTQIPTIQPADGFDRQVLYRAWMQSLPTAPVPDTFDSSVLRAARSGAMSHWWGLVIVALFLAVIGSITLFQDLPSVVTVVHAPISPMPTVDLYDLAPASVQEDLRFQEKYTARPGTALHGVAGY